MDSLTEKLVSDQMSRRKSGKFSGQPACQAASSNRMTDEEVGQTNQGYRFRQEADHAFLSWRSLQEWVFAKQYSQDVLGDQVRCDFVCSCVCLLLDDGEPIEMYKQYLLRGLV